ncbi:YceD family protein [Parerythrobacter lacustris]|uniref:DUF177 domain-containing protein n=1 Tax=Parerythrobacter lacustris TaxID=2969984 RepID=A0ABT1XSR8_9SPHN|nr:DUF177 domain-containing protein [Parerythrobacter lacustris]
MSAPEFSRPIKARALPEAAVDLQANDTECAALAARFGISSIVSLVARVSLDHRGKAVHGEGKLAADIVQTCAISGEDFPVHIEEPIAVRFVPEGAPPETPEIEIELDASELDEIEYSGDSFDLGEAVAQTLGLAIDPYAEGPDADAARKKAGIVTDDAPSGALAEALAAFKKG